MKKHLLLSTLLLGLTISASAEIISPETALARIQADKSLKKLNINNVSSFKLEKIDRNLFFFSNGKGFLILPNNDQSPALLGYSDNNSYINEPNPAFNEWISFYNRELDYLKDRENRQSTESERNLSSTKFKAKAYQRRSRNEIEPLIKTRWNQEWPFNIDCPKVGDEETVTGCVATAMAQGMKFYNFPEHGKGKHSYYWGRDKDTLSFDYENHNFKWDLMADVYDRDTPYDQRQAVAELMYACGVSVDMYYGPGESGAATSTMGSQLIDIFGYSQSMWLPDRGQYGLDEWEDMIYEQLQNGRPVLYSGNGTAGGHQFICDGYSNDGYFHFNWGWGGMSDGYFLLTALNPADLGVGGGAGGFNAGQHALMNFYPATADDKKIYLVTNGEEFITDKKSIRKGEKLLCSGSFFNYSLYKLPADARLALKFTSETDGEVIYVKGPGMGDFNPYDGRRDIEIDFPELTDGEYSITTALFADGEWFPVRGPIGYPSIIYANVNNGVAVLSNGEKAKVKVQEISIPQTIYTDHEFPLEFSVVNSSDSEFYGDVTPILRLSDNKEIAKSVERPVDVLPSATERVTDYIAQFKAVDGETLSSSTYELVFVDNEGTIVSDALEISLEESPETNEIDFLDFKIVTSTPVSDPKDILFSVRIDCKEGYYFGAPHMDVFHADGGDDIYSVNGTKLYLTSGESKECDFHADMSNIEDGNYIATVYDNGRNVTDLVRFSIKRISTDVREITINSDTNAYDLNGVPVEPGSEKGIIILGGKKVLF